jgi:class 3 adenylate cyclase/tetratricopeptide (TPR) repeat protein
MAAAGTCPSCGTLNPAQARFCNSCGAGLADVTAKQEERKLVSVLFVDLVGFTAHSEQADPEDVRDALQLYHAEAKARIEQYGGAVEKFIGDAVMAVFGAPVSHGDDAERAVRAGLRVLEGIGELNRTHGLDLAARAAVNTGEAVVAVGAQQAGDALALGDVVNTASRLQSAAPSGRLIVGEETYRASRHAFVYEQLPPVEAKGKTEPVPAWLAVEPSVSPAERPMATHPLVGRGREIELMRSVWERAVAERRSHLVTVLGPPGIGKSRLCREVSELVAADGGRIVRGRCLPYEEQTGYQAFATIVKETSEIFESDPQPVAREKLQHAVDALLPEVEAAEIARHLAFLVGVSGDVNVVQVGLLFFAARRFLECLGLVQPTLVVFEDIHWAQSSELELLEYLATHVRDSAVVLVALARPELLDAHPSWGGGFAAQTTIPLEPLTPDDAAELASHLVRSAAEKAPNIGRLVEVAEGNPLFLEELAASLTELHEDEELPVTVKAAIAARIDAMPAEARAALLAAAVVGKTFWRDVLQSMRVVDDLDDALSVLELRDLIRRDPSSQMPGDIQFTFKHMLIREVAYATVPRATRRARHAAVASYIERTSESSETLAWILAHHWREAGEPLKAIPYLLATAAVAQRGWAKGAAVDLYTKALELAEDDERRRRIRLQRGIALVALGDFGRAAEELGELLPELTGQERLEALLARGRATHWTERDEETLEIAKQAVALATELGDQEALPAAVALQAQAHAMAGDADPALELGERALVEWIPGTRPVDLTEHLHLHANVTYWAGDYDRCAELSRQARAFASNVHSAEALMRGGGTEALALAGMGQHEEAIRVWDELFAISRELGHNMRVLLNYSSLAFRELHDLGEARRRSEEALELSEGESFGMPRRFARADLLLTDLLAGDVGHAQAVWPTLWSDAQEATAWTKWLIYGRLAAARAEIALQAEGPEAAVEWAHKAIEIATQTRRPKYQARSLSVLGEAHTQLGRRDEALRALHDGVALADQLIGPPGRWDARAALGRAAYALGEDDMAAAAYVEAAELVRSFAETLAPARAELLLGAPAIEEILSLTR